MGVNSYVDDCSLQYHGTSTVLVLVLKVALLHEITKGSPTIGTYYPNTKDRTDTTTAAIEGGRAAHITVPTRRAIARTSGIRERTGG